jgi:XTP/dITP diphosphohydrolase
MQDESEPIIRPSSSVVHRAIRGRLVIATHNPGKLIELRGLLAPYGIDAISAGEMGLPEPDETGMTFRENARIKAALAAEAAGLPAFADDSGLVVEALDGAPGIHSARWAGPDRDFCRAIQIVEEKLRERGATTPERRRAHFISALCVAWPDGHVEEFEGRVSGTLIWPPRGKKGFGYDPMFLPDGYTRTFAEMSGEEKHGLPPRNEKVGARSDAKPPSTFADRAQKGLSHRARAFLKLAEACLDERR